MKQMLASATPRLAVIMPIFRHSSLLIEAIESVLAQRFKGGLRLLLINDGCPFKETDDVCTTYAQAYPEIITYLLKANGGLSDARNCGVDYVLEYLPSVEAIYLLDADNRLQPDALARAMSALDSEPKADWIYPNIDMFGLEWQSDFGGDYSLLIHSAVNICEAGSLFHRRVFESGVRSDTSFKMGWEDWDLFLSAARLGFRGKNIENFGFQYRKRPESMLADSTRDQGAIEAAMRQKHKQLLHPRSLIMLEQVEAPRYAIHLPDTAEVLRCVDPLAASIERVDFATFERDYWNSIISPGRHRSPSFNIILSSLVFNGLRDANLLHWVLWKLETICETEAIGILTLSSGESDRLSVSFNSQEDKLGIHREAVAVAFPKKMLSDIVLDESSEWIDSLVSLNPSPKVSVIDVRLPESSSISTKQRRAFAIFDALSFVHALRASKWRVAASFNWTHREIGITYRGSEHEILRRSFGNAPLMPRIPDGRRHIGFLLPFVEFGGVEKVAQQMARGLRDQGWVPHAFVLSSNDISFTPDWAEVFESTNLLTDLDFSIWGIGPNDYCGNNIPTWAQSGRHGVVLGMLHWLDAIINFHGGGVVGIMGQLRRMGIKTLNSLHLNDLTEFGRPVGNTYIGIAYEHAFDYFVPCSYQLGNWLHGMGVPRDKIIVVQNGPGFEVAPEITAKGIAARKSRDSSEPLRVLYLGRLDRQKGIDRLAEVIALSKAEGLSVIWRVLGKVVLVNDAHPIPPEVAGVLEPPVFSASELAEAYAWADVVVLLSRYEGLPLTVLEAMRAGAVIIATDVGATAEVVTDGVNGVLVPQEQAVSSTMDALRHFAVDRGALAKISENAYTEMNNLPWSKRVAGLASILKT